MMRISGFMEFCRFNGIDEEKIRSCSPYLKIKCFKDGEYIFQTGDKCDFFYCILKGKVSVKINNSNNKFKDLNKEKLFENEELIEEIKQYQRENTHRLCKYKSNYKLLKSFLPNKIYFLIKNLIKKIAYLQRDEITTI